MDDHVAEARELQPGRAGILLCKSLPQTAHALDGVGVEQDVAGLRLRAEAGVQLQKHPHGLVTALVAVGRDRAGEPVGGDVLRPLDLPQPLHALGVEPALADHDGAPV
eukprot:728063-Pyramimonas_sp.AAC.1